jgi:hypothetical protein
VGAALAARAIAFGMAGCAPSEEEVRQELADYVDGANSCSAASECAIVDAPCPLGCFVAVRADRVASVERKVSELLDEYTSGGRSCIYSCVAPGELECIRGRCAAGSY